MSYPIVFVLNSVSASTVFCRHLDLGFVVVQYVCMHPSQTPFSLFDTRAAARAYLQRCWWPIPVEFMGKVPVDQYGRPLRGWQDLRLKPDEVAAWFPERRNIGILLGEPSDWLIDVDLDCDEARLLADIILPSTNHLFGRTTAPRSHRLYKATSPSNGAKFASRVPAADRKAMICEVRANGQTVFPPSVHATAEAIRWEAESSPALALTEVLPYDLQRAVGLLAFIVELSRLSQRVSDPTEGHRVVDDVALSPRQRELAHNSLQLLQPISSHLSESPHTSERSSLHRSQFEHALRWIGVMDSDRSRTFSSSSSHAAPPSLFTNELAALALLQTTPSPLCAKGDKLLRHGESSADRSRSDTDHALIGYCVRAGWSFDTIYAALTNPSNCGPAKLQERLRMYGPDAARRYVMTSYVKVARSHLQQLNRIAEVARRIRAADATGEWRGIAGGSRRQVLWGHLLICRHLGSLEHAASVRQIAESSLLSPSTVQRAHSWLIHNEWLIKQRTPRSGCSRWSILAAAAEYNMHSNLVQKVHTVLTLDSLAHEAFSSRRLATGAIATGLGRAAAGALDMLRVHPDGLSSFELTALSGRKSVDHTTRILRRLERTGLVTATRSGAARGRPLIWKADISHLAANAALAHAAKSRGLEGTRAALRCRMQAQRQAFRDHCDRARTDQRAERSHAQARASSSTYVIRRTADGESREQMP